MTKKKKLRKPNFKKVQNVQNLQDGQQSEKSNTLIFGGVLVAMSSIGLLIFVLSNKIFHLS